MTIAFKHYCAHKNCVSLTLHDGQLPFWVIWSAARDPKEVRRIAGRAMPMPTVSQTELAFYQAFLEPLLLLTPSVSKFIALYGAENLSASFVHPKPFTNGCSVHLSFANEDYRAKFIALYGGFGTRIVDIGSKIPEFS